MAEIKVGNRVRLLDTPETRHDHEWHPELYPMPGTVGVVEEVVFRGNICIIQWPEKYFGKENHSLCLCSDVEVIE